LQTGNVVYNAAIQLHDIENNSWRNTSDTNGGWAYITTLVGHHINAYAQAAGYQDADRLNDLAASGVPYPINMAPTGIINNTPGNITLYVSVKNILTNAPIKKAGVTIFGVAGGEQLKYTGDNGVTSFIVPNKTLLSISVSDPAYQGASKGYTTGSEVGGGSTSETVSFLLYPIGVTPTQPNATPTPTITVCDQNGCHVVTPSPTSTILPGCEPPNENSAACASAHNDYNMNMLSGYAEMLIMLCIFVTVMYLLGIKLG
jgi:hypothetical protein